ncbi:MAG TPA: PDZ domain-containing protein [Acidimicrobiia bacterium]|nr:PDZ domain-containing protein [Acidimicrobiia bacterium]
MNETVRERRRWPIVVACLALVIAGLLIGAWNITLPYYAFSPGPVGDALEAIKASEVETYRANEELLMLTVSSQEVNPIEAFLAGIDPTVDLVAREAVRRPDETDEEFVTRNQASMDLSKETAITLALRRLGYEVATTSEGVLIADVDETAPAIDVLQVDDVIIAVEGVAVSLPEDIGTAIADNEPGDLITLDLKRDDETLTAQVELVAREDDPNAPLIGISVAALEPRFEFPFPIDIDAGLIGGPSAGMMYTLAVMELLGPESLSSGHVIAGTGTIDVDGNVGGIGGVRQKVVAAEAAGAEVMLVPASNYDEALTAPANGIELIPVATLDEVLDALANL